MLARRAALTTSALLALTIVHHAYGAIIYQTPWRFHVAPPALGAMLLLVVALVAHQELGDTRGGRLALGVALAVIFGVVVGVGFFEGGYNHLLKTIALGRRRPDADPAPDVPAADVRPAEQRRLRGDGDPAVRPGDRGCAGWDSVGAGQVSRPPASECLSEQDHEKQRKMTENTKIRRKITIK